MLAGIKTLENTTDPARLAQESAQGATGGKIAGTDLHTDTKNSSTAVPTMDSEPPGSLFHKPSSLSADQTQEQDLQHSNPAMSSEDQASENQAPSSMKKRSKIGSHEAIRRGLSFGPIKKPSSTQTSSTGILKPESKSLSYRLAQRSLSSGNKRLSLTEAGGSNKDQYADDADSEGAIESSDDDLAESSGDDTSNTRGRKRAGEIGKRTIAQSPLARSDDHPAVTVTAPEGERQPSAKRFIVHPNTNFDQGVSRPASPHTSDSEELNDIRRAQKLSITASPVDSSVPHRVIQTIIRGDFASMQEEAKEGTRRLRTYLVPTDLSGEAAYALEWTIGTVLRDGDTLLAVYAVDEEIGTGVTEDCLPVGDGAKAMQDTTAAVERMTVATQKGSFMPFQPLTMASFRPSSRKSSTAHSADSRALSRAELERAHAIEKLSETCLRFLRKTKLQVRIAIEVIHCKNPKCMIIEAVSLVPSSHTSIVSCLRDHRLRVWSRSWLSSVLGVGVLSKGIWFHSRV